MSKRRVLFLGEGDLAGPARYLASVLRWARIPFDHRPDQAKIPKAWRKPGRYQSILLSDYRYKSFTPCSREWLMAEVRERGTGLLMIGGWASFTGLVGGYSGTDIETLLPVRCVPGDDRVNCASGSVLTNAEWGSRNSDFYFPHSDLPLVCGYHRVIAKPHTTTVLSLRDLKIRGTKMTLGPSHPLLVLGSAGRAKTAAFLTDCAPHWAGGLVDWGKRRVVVNVNAQVTTELGEAYLAFFANLIHRLAPSARMKS